MLRGARSEACTVAWMPRANGPECGTKAICASTPVAAARRRGSRARGDAQRAVGVQIAVPRGMVRAVDGFAARAGAAGDAGYEQSAPASVRSASSGTDGQQCRGGKAAGMRHVRRSASSLQVLGHRAGELRQTRRSTVRVSVDGLVGVVAAEAEIGRDVDHVRRAAGGLGGLEQPSINAAAPPCGAAEKIAVAGSRAIIASMSSDDLKRSSG